MLTFILISCGNKDATTTAAPEAAKKAMVSNAPDDADSQKFAAALTGLNIENWQPADSSGAKFVYDKMSFNGDGSWDASGYIEADFEKIECEEGGNWIMEPAEDPASSVVTWTVATTDCPMRESGFETRALMTIDKDGSFDTKFR